MIIDIYNIANKTQCDIQDVKHKLERIQILMHSCGLHIEITGTPKGRHGQLKYVSMNKDEIIKLLESDKEKLTQELKDLELKFSLL